MKKNLLPLLALSISSIACTAPLKESQPAAPPVLTMAMEAKTASPLPQLLPNNHRSTLCFTVRWPKRSTLAIPDTTDRLVVSVLAQKESEWSPIAPPQTINRTPDQPIGKAEFILNVVGTVKISVTALNSSNQTVASGESSVILQDNTAVDATITLTPTPADGGPTGTLSLGISLAQGAEATASTGVTEYYWLDVRKRYEMPRAVGTTWSYELTEGLRKETMSYTVCQEPNKGLCLKNTSNSWGVAEPYDSFNDYSLPSFTGIAGTGLLQWLGQESLLLPFSATPQTADHYYVPLNNVYEGFSENGGTDAWFVHGIGLVKLKTMKYTTTSSKSSTVQTIVLMQFTQEN